MNKKYPVITLCGSSRFREKFIEVANKLTLQDYIVLTPSFVFEKSPDLIVSNTLRETLASMHNQRIDMADEILVINKNGYIGESTKSEIEYAKKIIKKLITCITNVKSLLVSIKKSVKSLKFLFVLESYML